MRENRKGGSRAAVGVLVAFLALVFAFGFMRPGTARAQVYSVTTTTVAPTTTTSTTVPPTTTPSIAPAKGTTTTSTTVKPTTTTTTTVVPVTTAPKHALAFTGADIAATMGAAAVALGIGGGLVLVSRKRKAAK